MQIPRRKPLTANVAVVSVGFKTYWNQFDGLLDEMHRKGNLFCSKVAACGVNVNNFGLVDDPQSAQAVLPQLLASDPDILFVHMATYSTSIPLPFCCAKSAVRWCWRHCSRWQLWIMHAAQLLCSFATMIYVRFRNSPAWRSV